jgi:type IV fimbrial biogenesis protein FimT
MKKRVLQLVSTGGKNLNKNGFSMLELMAVVLIIAIAAMTTMPLLQEQIAVREIETIARRFIAHAHFARQQALHLGQSVHLVPISGDRWEEGWVVKSVCPRKSIKADCIDKRWFSQASIDPVYFKGGGKQFIDPNSGKRGILFNAAGAAKTAQGGFVANRLILGHSRAPEIERQMILGSGGRWRICDPARDAKRCH